MNEENDNPLEEMLRNLEKRKMISDLIEAQTDTKGEEAEREILMRLWGELGNSQHNYYIALQAAGAFVTALKEMRKVHGLPDDLAMIVTKALADCALLDLECIQIVKKIKEEHGYEED